MEKLERIIRCGEGCPGECCLVCPQCDWNYVHPISVKVTRKKESTEVNSRGIFICNTENPDRGVTIEIEYACESGHHGILKFTFHKGNTFVTHEKLEDFSSYKEWETIWRD